MAHLRRIHFQGRKCCSTVSVASMPDFSDGYFEELKKKIRLLTDHNQHNYNQHQQQQQQQQQLQLQNRQKLSPSKEEEEEAAVFQEEKSAKSEVEKDQKSSEKKDEQEAAAVVQPTGGDGQNSAIIFSLKNQVTGLVRALRVFQEFNINVRHIESRKSRRKTSQYEIYVDIDCEDKEKMNVLLHHLRHEVDCTTYEEFERIENSPMVKEFPALKTGHSILTSQSSFDTGELIGEDGMPWFPKRIIDIDLSANRVLMYGAELDADHPVSG